MFPSRVAIFSHYLLWCSPVATLAWGTSSERKSPRHVVGYGLSSKSQQRQRHELRASEYDNYEWNCDDDEVRNRSQRSSPLDEYFYDTIGNDIVTNDKFWKAMNRFDSVFGPQQPNDDVATEWFNFSLEEDLCGEECDEVCAIPDHYKSEKSETIDVMAYLGIRRAAPLQVDPTVLHWQ